LISTTEKQLTEDYLPVAVGDKADGRELGSRSSGSKISSILCPNSLAILNASGRLGS
jgi:hypothetical protein